jgi:hypothetical protein
MRSPVPWIGLAALAAMFLLPWLDARGLFDGPSIIRRWPHRVVCADCASPWTPGHQCAGWLEAAVREPVVPLRPLPPPPPQPQRVDLVRLERQALAPRRRPS